MPRYKEKIYTCPKCGIRQTYKTPQSYSAHFRRCGGKAEFSPEELPRVMRDQTAFDSSIGRLDRILSELIAYSDKYFLDSPNLQTLKHHAEDMQGAAKKILENIHAC